MRKRTAWIASVVLLAGLAAAAWWWQGFRSRDLASARKTSTPAPYEIPARRTALDRHIMLKKTIRLQQPRVVLVGDSLTQRWESDGRRIWETAIAPLDVFNAGIDHDRTENLLWRLQDGALDEANPPDVCVLMIGINNLGGDGDTPHGVAHGVIAVARSIRATIPDTRLVIVGLLPAGPWSRGILSRRARTNLAIKAHLPPQTTFADFSDAFLNKHGGLLAEMTTDGLHLSEQGYRKLAELLVPAIHANLE